MRLRYINKVLAVFFLVYSLGDFCCLPACCGEEARPPVAATTIADVNLCGDSTLLSEPEASRHEDESQPCQDDEGCFCCAHVVPGSPVTMAAFNMNPPGSEQPSTFLPKSPPRTLFHPPRSA